MSTSPPTPAPTWAEKRTERFVFLFEPSSYAARAIDEIALRAEAAYQRGWEWFFGDQPRPTVTVYLTDWLQDESPPGWLSSAGALVGVAQRVVWLHVSPEQPALELERTVLQILARVASGTEPGPATTTLSALGGVIAAEQGVEPSPDESDRAAHERCVRRKQPACLFEDGPQRQLQAADPADVSFLLFLQRTYGRAALARFARAMLLQEPDAAAQSAYSKPLNALQDEWLSRLRGRFRAEATGQDVLRRSFPLLRPHWPRVVELLVYMLFDMAFTVAVPLSNKYLFDNVIPARDFSLLVLWLVVLPLIFTADAFFGYRRVLVGGLIGESVLHDMRRSAFAHLQRLSLRFYAHSSTGDLLSRLTHDMDAVQGALGRTLPQLLFQTISLIMAAVVVLLLNWMLGLVVLALGIPIYASVYSRYGPRLRQASRTHQNRVGAMTGVIQENLTAQMVVKSFSLEKRAITSFEASLSQLMESSLNRIRLGGLLNSSSSLVFAGVRLLVLGAGAALIMSDRMSVGELVAFVGLIGQVLSPVTSIPGQYQQVQSATGAFDRVQELMEETPDVAEDPLAVDQPDLERELRLENVTFRYGDGQAVLRDVALAIPAGGRVAIVGPSGAGKSTLVGLLLRLYDPSEGRILFDGRDIRGATLASIRQKLAIVPQETYLFNATIRENIGLGREGAGDEQVMSSAKAAALHQFIEQTEAGYETVVGERGVRLSGGQRQRLAIARALIRDPQVLILDEATSALDAETEAAIMHTLEQVGRGRTTVMITHRLTSAAQCDWIFVLDQGRLVEQGTHEQLCELQGVYWRLYSEQQAGVLETAAVPIERRLLARVPLFASLTPAELAMVTRRATVEQYETATTIVRQGEPADKLYVIDEGQVEVLVEDRQGELRRVKTLGSRSYFGEIALLGDGETRRMATVRTLTPVELYSLHKEDFLSLLKTQPRLAEAIARLARMRSEQTRRLAELAS